MGENDCSALVPISHDPNQIPSSLTKHPYHPLAMIIGHPLLRILAAFLIGLWSPLCCCQSEVLLGSHCPSQDAAINAPPSASPKTKSCCGSGDSCGKQDRSRAPAQSQEPSTDPLSPATEDSPTSCNSCPSCLTTAREGFARQSVETESASWISFSVPPATLWEPPSLHQLRHSDCKPSWPVEFHHLRANRSALRWHCALIV